MPPEDAAAVLRKVNGVASVEVKHKKGKEPRLAIAYTDGRVRVGDYAVDVAVSFSGGTVSSVMLSHAACATAGIERTRYLAATLAEKFGNETPLKIVDGDGIAQENRVYYWNADTQVTLATVPVPLRPAAYTFPTGSGLVRSMTQLANSLEESRYANGLAACPYDRGARLITTITYASRAAFLAAQRESADADIAKAKATAAGL